MRSLYVLRCGSYVNVQFSTKMLEKHSKHNYFTEGKFIVKTHDLNLFKITSTYDNVVLFYQNIASCHRSLVHRFGQIWPLAISICSQASKAGSGKRDLVETRKSWLKKLDILRKCITLKIVIEMFVQKICFLIK